MKINKTTKVAVGSVLVTLVLVAAGSWAYVSAAGGTINACVAKGGDTRILLSGSTCKGSEQLVSWNIMGPQGLQGSKGDKGDQGPQGTTGTPLTEDAKPFIRRAVICYLEGGDKSSLSLNYELANTYGPIRTPFDVAWGNTSASLFGSSSPATSTKSNGGANTLVFPFVAHVDISQLVTVDAKVMWGGELMSISSSYYPLIPPYSDGPLGHCNPIVY